MDVLRRIYDLKLLSEAEHIAEAFVKPDGSYAYK